jgi:ABC-type uncharacterized transport system auxiliary subunit
MSDGRGGSEAQSTKRVRSPRNHQPRRAAGAGLLAALALVAVNASGCGSARPSKYYQLTVPGNPPAVERPDSVPVTLLVGGFMTSQLYREDCIVYGSGPEELGTYEYHRWAEPPTEMIEEILLRELRASGHYRAVRVRRSNVRGDFVIRGRLYDFKEVDGNPISARVTLELEMRDLNSGATVWSHYYTHDEPASGKDVPSIVSALDQNVQRGIKEIIASLDQYFASHPMK